LSLSDSVVHHLQGVLRVPETAGGRYAIGSPIGQGGMGTVYSAQDLALDRPVALKAIRADVAGPEAEGRLRREARILARLEHPGIVPVHDVGVLADGRVFYVMKLVRGARLEAYARTATLTERLRLFLRVCETVEFAHAQGVVHRDLKPSNIMVGAFGEVLVLDWGIARLLRSDASAEPTPVLGRSAGAVVELPGSISEPRTNPGTVLGTPGFMAPEQAQGWTQLIGPRTDVHALGAILHFLVNCSAPAVRPPRPLVSIWSKAMEPEPDHRYPSAEELREEIVRFLDGVPVRAHLETLPERIGRLFRRYQTAIVLILTYLSIRLLFLALRGF